MNNSLPRAGPRSLTKNEEMLLQLVCAVEATADGNNYMDQRPSAKETIDRAFELYAELEKQINDFEEV